MAKNNKKKKDESVLAIPFAAMVGSQTNVGMEIGADAGNAGLRDYLACQMLTDLHEENQDRD